MKALLIGIGVSMSMMAWTGVAATIGNGEYAPVQWNEPVANSSSLTSKNASSLYAHKSYFDGKFELSLSGDLLLTSDTRWDIGIVGATAGGTVWASEYLGFSASVGIQKWAVDESMSEFKSGYFMGVRLANDYHYEGAATAVPLGGSLRLRVPIEDLVSFEFEGGVKYVIMNSDIEEHGKVSAYYGGTDNYYIEKIDTENGVVGFFSCDMRLCPSKTFSIFLGAGYQFDLSKAAFELHESKNYAFFEREDSNLAGMTFRIGCAWMF